MQSGKTGDGSRWGGRVEEGPRALRPGKHFLLTIVRPHEWGLSRDVFTKFALTVVREI